MLPIKAFLDTVIDTNKKTVSIQINIVLRNYVNKKGEKPIYLYISQKNNKIRKSLDLKIDPVFWNPKKQRCFNKYQHSEDVNLLLDNLEAKISDIRVRYRLTNRLITPSNILEELNGNLSNIYFVSFFKKALAIEKKLIAKGTYRRYNVVYKKLKEFNSTICFADIDVHFIKKFKIFLTTIKKNAPTTINSNLKVVKRFLSLAKKQNIFFPLELDDVKIKSTEGNRIFLTPSEINLAIEYFHSKFINKDWKVILGYFLFSSMTGLRFSDVMNLDRKNLLGDEFNFVAQKTKKPGNIILNNTVKKIIEAEQLLFVKKLTNEYVNRELKGIFKQIKIYKKITFHVSRHSFATNYLRAHGKVERLQQILQHSKIEQTMIYVHIIASEANQDILKMDALFDNN